MRFTFAGTEYEGFEGETLAAALVRNGVLGGFTSIYRGRPRGVYTAGEEEPNALVQIGAEPMLRATLVELHDGLVAEPLAGKGRLLVAPAPRYDAIHAHCETLVDKMDAFTLSADGRTLLYRDGKRLRALEAGKKHEDKGDAGYPEPLEASARPSPHRMIRAYADYMQARKLMEEKGSLTEASTLLRSALAANPENHKAWFFLGLAARDLGHDEDAIEAFRRVLLAPGGERISAELNLGVCLYNAGQLDLALDHVAHALEDTIGPPGALELYAKMLEESGRTEEAARQRARTRACEPASSDS